jgi:hypothetical protein
VYLGIGVAVLAPRDRPPIREEVARTLRSEARFGCCRCGFPFFQYHHIVEWSDEHHYRPEDMMVLCPNCHDMATKGALTVPEQRKFKSRPHNVRKGYAAGFLTLPASAPALNLGGTVFVNDGTVLAFRDTPVLAVGRNEAGGLELSVVLQDQEGRTLALIERNEWIAGETGVWDLEAGYRWMKLRQRKGKIALEIDGTQWPIKIRASLWGEGRQIFVGPRGLAFGGVQRSVQWFNLTFAATYFSFDAFEEPGPGAGKIALRPVPNPKYGEGKFWSGTDAAIVATALEHLASLQADASTVVAISA